MERLKKILESARNEVTELRFHPKKGFRKTEKFTEEEIAESLPVLPFTLLAEKYGYNSADYLYKSTRDVATVLSGEGYFREVSSYGTHIVHSDYYNLVNIEVTLSEGLYKVRRDVSREEYHPLYITSSNRHYEQPLRESYMERCARNFNWKDVEPLESNKVLDTFLLSGDCLIDRYHYGALPSDSVTTWVKKYICDNIDPSGREDDILRSHFLIYFCKPEMSKLVPGNISIWDNYQKSQAGRETSRTPGKTFRYLCPWATDKEVEAFTLAYQKEFPTEEYALAVGTEREDYKKAFMGPLAKSRHFATTDLRKSSYNSCMRHDWAPNPHPAEAYATEDFQIWTAVNIKGEIGARSVVNLPTKNAAPIYGASETAINFLESELSKAGFTVTYEGYFEGTMLAIPRGSAWVFPYLDNGQAAEYDSGDKIIRLLDTEMDQSTSGYSYLEGCGETCSCCDETYNENDMTYVEGHGLYCDNCLAEEFFIGHFSYERYRRYEAVEIYTGWGYTELEAEYVVDRYADYCSERGQWYVKGILVLDEDGEPQHPEDIFTSDLTGCIWHEDLEVVGINKLGEEVKATKKEFEDAGWKLDETVDTFREEKEAA